MVSLIVHSACSSGTGIPPSNGDRNGSDSEVASFANDLIPILTVNCAGCHSEGGVADLEGIDLRLTADVAFDMLAMSPSQQVANMAIVEPGNADESYLFIKISQDNPPVGVRMPRSLPPLSDDEIATVRAWIEQGAQDN